MDNPKNRYQNINQNINVEDLIQALQTLYAQGVRFIDIQGTVGEHTDSINIIPVDTDLDDFYTIEEQLIQLINNQLLKGNKIYTI